MLRGVVAANSKKSNLDKCNDAHFLTSPSTTVTTFWRDIEAISRPKITVLHQSRHT